MFVLQRIGNLYVKKPIIFHPDKINYGSYADTGCHLHVHLVPKYKDQFEWNTTFEMNPQRIFLSDEEYADMIEKIKQNL